MELTIVTLCCTKNIVTSTTSAGKASLFSTPCRRSAVAGRTIASIRPNTIGTAISTMFCISRFITGNSTCVVLPTACVTTPISAGMVNSVITLLSAVSDTDRATSPPASIENTLLELPPGLHAISIMPMANSGGMLNALHIHHAISGSITICPISPAIIGIGRYINNLKS